MKKSMRKALALVLALLMTVPLMALGVSADTLPENYADVADGALIYKVDFRGTEGYWEPVAAWGGMKDTPSEDGTSINLIPNDSSNGYNSVWGAALPAEESKTSDGKFRMLQSAYTVVFTLDAEDENQEVGLCLDWATGFAITPGKDSFRYVKGKENETVFTGTYQGTKALKQTYAIEIKDEGTATNINDHTTYSYNCTVYNLYVIQDGEWVKIFSLDTSADASKLKSALNWGSGDWEFVLRLFRDSHDAYQYMNMEVSEMSVYKGLAIAGGIVDAQVATLEAADDGELLYTANFAGDSRWQPSAATAAANAGYNWACDKITATVDATDNTKATIKLTEQGNSAWGADIEGLPLGAGNAYTVKYTVTRSSNAPIGLLIDGHHGGNTFAAKARMQKNGSKLTDYVEYSTLGVTIPGTTDISETNPSVQEYAIEVNGDTGAIALYVKDVEGKWNKITEGTLTADTRDTLGLYFYSYNVTEVTVSDVNIHKGITLLAAENEALLNPDNGDSGDGNGDDAGDGSGDANNDQNGDTGTKKENKAPVLVEDETEAETEAETATEEKGCGGSIALGGVALVMTVVGIAGIAVKKNDEE